MLALAGRAQVQELKVDGIRRGINAYMQDTSAACADCIATASGVAGIIVHAQSGAQVRHAEAVASLPLAGLPGGIYKYV